MLRYAISDGHSALAHQRPHLQTAGAPGQTVLPSDLGLILPAEHPKANPSLLREADDQRPHPTPARHDRLLAQARSLAARQVDFFLLREPDLPAGQLAGLAREILAIFTDTPTRLLLHSRADVAAATQAPGVHLSSTPGSLTPNQVRTVYASVNLPPPIVSLSCHTQQDIEDAHNLHPDLVLFGPVFGKTIANQLVTPPTGLEALRQACRLAHPTPVLALGGITQANTPACLEAGAAGIAAIRLFANVS